MIFLINNENLNFQGESNHQFIESAELVLWPRASHSKVAVVSCNVGSIMHRLGVPATHCADIDEYCRWMVIMAILLVPISHLESVFINLGYAKSSTFNSFLTGLGVDVVSPGLGITLGP